MTTRVTITILGFAAVLFLSAPVHAGYVYCPGTPDPGDREFGVEVITASGTATCFASGTGNVGGSDSDFPGYTYLDKDDDEAAVAIPEDWFTITGMGTTSGTFTISSAIWQTYSSLIILFKSGEGQLDPDWVAFTLTPEVLTGNWSISGNQALSHAILYGGGTPTVIPEPASMLLFGTGLIGVAQAARKRLRERRA
jgi:hypothetical protein